MWGSPARRFAYVNAGLHDMGHKGDLIPSLCTIAAFKYRPLQLNSPRSVVLCVPFAAPTRHTCRYLNYRSIAFNTAARVHYIWRFNNKQKYIIYIHMCNKKFLTRKYTHTDNTLVIITKTLRKLHLYTKMNYMKDRKQSS